MKRILQIIVWLIGLWFTNTASAAEFDEAFSAYNAGDYQTAIQTYKALAAEGDARAQYNLGVMYEKGQGVLQDYKEAVEWYRIAAAQGDAVNYATSGEADIKFGSPPSSTDNGKQVYLSTTSAQATFTPPSSSGETVVKLGKLKGGNGATSTPSVVLNIDYVVTL